jgi:hypothetical protein
MRIEKRGMMRRVLTVTAVAVVLGSGGLAGASAKPAASPWTVQATPILPQELHGTLSGVSCASATQCVAVGQMYRRTWGAALAETWNGTKWSPHNIAKPGINTAPLRGRGTQALVGPGEYGPHTAGHGPGSQRVQPAGGVPQLGGQRGQREPGPPRPAARAAATLSASGSRAHSPISSSTARGSAATRPAPTRPASSALASCALGRSSVSR